MSNYTISNRTIYTFISIVVGIYLASLIKDVILLLSLSFILAVALEPYVTKLVKKGYSRTLVSVLIVLISLGVIISLLVLSFGIVASQMQEFITGFPEKIAGLLNIEYNGEFSNKLFGVAETQIEQGIKFVGNAFNFILTTVFIFAITLYILIDFVNLRKSFVSLFHINERDSIKKLIIKIENKMGAWVRGQLILMASVGIATVLVLFLLGVPYAIPLAILAALLEVVPIIGPIIAIVPATLVGLSIDPLTGILVAISYILIQQIEYQFIVPKVMQRAVGQNPIVTMVSILIGGQLFSVIGAIMAVPTAVILTEIYRYFQSRNK